MIVVTGASGMLGSQVVLQLSQKFPEKTIHAWYRSESSRAAAIASWSAQDFQGKSVHWVKVDLENQQEVMDAMQGASHVVHAAAMVSFRQRDAMRMQMVNPLMAEHVALAAADSRVRNLIHVSSVAALGKEADKAISIHSIPDRKTLRAYGKSKLDSELVMQRYHAEGMPLWVLNPTVILGPPAWPDGSSGIPRSIAKGMPFASKGSTGWVDVRDVAVAICHLIDAKGLGKQVLLNGHNASFSKLFSVLATAMGKTPPRWLIPKWLLLSVAHIEAILDRLIGRKANLGIDGARAASAISQYDNQSAIDQGLAFRSLEATAAFIAKTQKILQSA